MERITKRNGSEYTADDLQAAVIRLGQFEDLYESLCDEREKAAEKMKALSAAGKTKTASYRQLFANKLTSMNLISKIEIFVK